MYIAFCDDHNIITNQLNKFIQEFDKENQKESTLLSFSTPSDLYTYMQTNSIDVVFMDLEFPDTSEDGIEWSKKIKKQFPRTIIIILTAYEARYKEGFVARAFRFMTKPIQKAELFDNLYACMEELQLTQTISLFKYGTLHQVMIKDISYLSALSGGSELWTRSNTFVSEKSLIQWEEQLPKTTFFRCHKKYMINLLHVKSFENQVLTLVTGEKIPISRRRWKEFQIAYIRCDIQNNSIT